MRSKQMLTNYDKRKLTYDKNSFSNLPQVPKKTGPLDLPPEFEKKISSTEHRKLKQAFFIEADKDLTLSRSKFPVAMRSLGIIMNTSQFYKVFDELDQKWMTWKQFLQAYIAKRTLKGSYNELSHAVYGLAREYRGDWDQMLMDLQTLGDVLTRQQIQILKKDILKGNTLTSESLINGLLYQK